MSDEEQGDITDTSRYSNKDQIATHVAFGQRIPVPPHIAVKHHIQPVGESEFVWNITFGSITILQLIKRIMHCHHLLCILILLHLHVLLRMCTEKRKTKPV